MRFICLLITLLSLSSVWIIAKPVIAVFPIKNTGKHHPQLTSKIITSKVVNAFVNKATLKVVEHENLPEVFQNVNIDSALDARLLKDIQADYLCFGTFSCSIKKTAIYLRYIRSYMCRIHGRVEINLRIVDVKTARIVAFTDKDDEKIFKKKSPTKTISTPDSLFDHMCKEAIPKAINDLIRKMPPEKEDEEDDENEDEDGIQYPIDGKRYPRLMIMLKTNRQGLPQNLDNSFNQDTVQIGLEGVFQKAGFRVQNVAQVKKLRKRRIQLAIQDDDIDLLAALGKKLDTELILCFDFRATLEKGNIYGTSAKRYSMITAVQGRIFRVDTGEYLAPLSKSYAFSGLKSTFTIHGGFSNAGKKFARDIIEVILRQWMPSVEILVSGISYRKVRKIKKSLQKNRSIKQLTHHSFSDKVWHATAITGLPFDKILDLFIDLGEPHGLDFEIKESSQNKIVLKIK